MCHGPVHENMKNINSFFGLRKEKVTEQVGRKEEKEPHLLFVHLKLSSFYRGVSWWEKLFFSFFSWKFICTLRHFE